MASDASCKPNWVGSPPAAHDIVTAWFPEKEPSPDGSLKLRPCLVLNVLKGRTSGNYSCLVAYGTSKLKIHQRQSLDLIIQNSRDLDTIGLPVATRFDLDEIAQLPWDPEFFESWSGYQSPIIGSLTEIYIKELAYILMSRMRA